MARTESRTKTSIWNNEEFRARSRMAQRLYWLLYSQPTISLCGVLAYTPGRWAGLASDDTTEDVRGALCELTEYRFVVVDGDTEEVFVRSFMRNDGVWRSPKTRAAAKDQAVAVMSLAIRRAIEVEMSRLEDGESDTPSGTPQGDPPDTGPDTTRVGAHAASNSLSDSSLPLRSPSPNDDDPSRVSSLGIPKSVSSSPPIQSIEEMNRALEASCPREAS